MTNPILLDSAGKPFKVSTAGIRNSFDNRGRPLTANQGSTLLSRFAGNKELAKFKKLASDIEAANPAIRSPLLNQSNFYMPENDSSTGEPNRLLNQWITYYVKWHPLLGNLLSLHSELPMSRFGLRGIDDKKILQFYEDMVESMELQNKAVELLRQYFTYGEVCPFAFWSEKYNCFTDLTFIDNNFIYVKGHYLLHSEDGDDTEFYELEPDPMLIGLVKSDDHVSKMLRQYVSDDFVAAVHQNKRLILSNFSTHMIKNKVKWSDLRGTSIVLRCLKSLLLGDKYTEANYAIADGHVNPKWIWKIGQAGDLSTGGYMPSEDDLSAFRDLLIDANNDPIFTIITHYAVNVEAVGLNGKLLPLQSEFQKIEDDILTALFSNKAVTTGQGPNFSTASVAFRAMMARYIPIRARVERYFYQKLFAPVAYANKFYTRKQCDLAHGVRTGDDETNQLIIPKIDWRSKSNLLDDGSIKSIISSLVSNGKLPMKILTEALDLDYDEVRNYLYAEQGTVFDNVTVEARKALSKTNADETMMGQPFAPKNNSAVSSKALPKNVDPKAKKAASKMNLLSIQPINKLDSDIQTKIDQGKPEKGGNPKVKDPMAEALKLESRTFDNTNVSNIVSSKSVKNSFDKNFDKKSKTSEQKVLI